MHEKLIELINSVIKLSEEEVELCKKNFEPIIYPKNKIIEEEGVIPEYLYFVVSGYMRLFQYNDNGDEITTHINCPPGFITSYTSFINQTISNDNLECITDCRLLRISKKKSDLIISKSKSFKDFSIWVLNKSIQYNENRTKELTMYSAEQRYLNLIKNYPDILYYVPLQYIASFLGMNPKSLSRIRKQVIR